MKKLAFACLLGLLGGPSVFSQSTPEDLIAHFFTDYKEDIVKAFDNIYATNKWISAQSDDIVKLKSQLQQFELLVGDYIGEEFLAKSSMGEDYVMFVYFAKYERQPVRFTFHFYRTNGEWKIFAFRYDDSFGNELEDLLKYEYMQTKY